MSISVKPWKHPSVKLFNNPHFWVIIGLFMVIAALYYQDLFLREREWLWFWQLEVFEFSYHIHGILFCIPVLYAAAVFWWKGALTIWVASMAAIAPRMLFFEPHVVSIITNTLYLLIPLMIVVYLAIILNWRERERKASMEREAERQSFISQIFKAQEDERHRLALELHDEATQTLLVIATRAQELSCHDIVKSAPEAKEKAEWIKNTAMSVSEELRRLSLDLRPGILDNLGLIPALRWMVNVLPQEGINARIEFTGSHRKLPPEIDINIFRIVQEALNNIRRHSRATEVMVNLIFTENTIKIVVQDNGIGFTTPKTSSEYSAIGKLGLIGMQQRTQLLNGIFKLHSEVGKGTTVEAEFVL
jgi:two-component system, NarL family, sensor histidine kinase DegS